jgi:hypothetical protein
LSAKPISIFVSAMLLCVYTPAIAIDRSYPVRDGMVLRLGNAVQRVRVRAKSFGPGGCGVTFTLSGKEAGSFVAPPLTWSPLTPIGDGYLGRANPTLGFDAICDTGVLVEVRYQINVASALVGSWLGTCDWNGDTPPLTVPATFGIFEENGNVSVKYHSVNDNETVPLSVDDNTLQINLALSGYPYTGKLDDSLAKFDITNSGLQAVCHFHM